MRPVIVAGNWKMHTTPAEAGELAATIARRTNEPDVVRVLCPPFVSLAAVRDALEAEPGAGAVAVGAQNVHHETTGPYTGEVSAHMLQGLASWVIVGHSERRRDAGETDELISRKVQRALDTGLRVILCVGEQLEDREAGHAADLVRTQVRGSLDGVDVAAIAPLLTIAYEPVWAIGTGRHAQGSDAAAMAAVIRATLGGLGFDDRGEEIPVLYGGSVSSSNIGDFMDEPSIDGALVGGASLKPDEMAGIVARAGLTARARAQR
ncbi:MAG: triose-phosphate isomerase [Chloroflexi bacterium]|nr:triose-phosphate isomerase [Chloroflexota bacterium]